MNTFGKQMFAI